MTSSTARLRRILLGGTALALAGAFPAYAATAAATATDTASGNQIEEVIVTARRVSERLQDVPSAITAVSSKQLETLRPRTLEDLDVAVDGLLGLGQRQRDAANVRCLSPESCTACLPPVERDHDRLSARRLGRELRP